MGITNFPNVLSTDVLDGLKYKSALFTTSTTNSDVTVVDIQGSGYLKTALVYNTNTSITFGARIKITLDGSVILDTATVLLSTALMSGYNCYGIGIAESMLQGSASDTTAQRTAGIIPKSAVYLNTSSPSKADTAFPSNAQKTITNQGLVYVLGRPIKFNSSLKVEMLKADSTNIGGVVEYYM